MTTIESPTGPGLFAQLLDPANRADPYLLYTRIRTAGPTRLGKAPVIVLSSYRDCRAILRDPDTSVERRHATIPMGAMPIYDLVGAYTRCVKGTTNFLFRDPPDHTRLRRLVGTAFSPAAVRSLAPRIAALVDDLLDRAARTGHLDIVADLAYPLPITVICELLGIPSIAAPQLRHWSTPIARTLDPISATATAGRPDAAELVRASNGLYDFFDDIIRHRRHRPGDDLLSALIAAEDSGDTLTHDELIATCVLLLIAGHETTVNLIANAVLALLRHPQHLHALREAPDLAAPIVEETLRYDPPVQLIPRIARNPIDLNGFRVARGDLIIALTAAAHRDPAAYDNPDTFDPHRNPHHLGFGLGPHFCLGAPLARLEAQLTLTRFAQRVTDPQLTDDPPPYREHVTLRGPAQLPLTFTSITPTPAV